MIFFVSLFAYVSLQANEIDTIQIIKEEARIRIAEYYYNNHLYDFEDLALVLRSDAQAFSKYSLGSNKMIGGRFLLVLGAIPFAISVYDYIAINGGDKTIIYKPIYENKEYAAIGAVASIGVSLIGVVFYMSGLKDVHRSVKIFNFNKNNSLSSNAIQVELDLNYNKFGLLVNF